MTKAFIAAHLQASAGLTSVASREVTNALIDAISLELKRTGRFSLPTFGTFRVLRMKARKAMNPRTGEKIKVKASRRVSFKASPSLRGALK